MIVRVEDVSSIKKVLHIEIPEDTVKKEVDGAYKELKQTTTLKGFRKGKVPRSVLERYYRKQVDTTVIQSLVESSFSQAVQENNIQVLGNPQIDPPELDYQQAYKFDATVEILPEIGTIDYKNLTLKKNIYEASESEVNTQLALIREKLAQPEPIQEERSVAEDDMVRIDFEGFLDGKSFDRVPKSENFTLKLGASHLPKPVEAGIVGMKPGDEKEIEVVFPPGYPDEAFAGKTIVYKVHFQSLMQEVLPELNDEFVQKISKDLKTMDEFREEIRKSLQEGYNKRSEQELTEAVYSALLERNDFEVPDLLVNMELTNTIRDTERRLNDQNMTWEQFGSTPEAFAEKYRHVAVAQVKRELLMVELVSQESLAITDEEKDAGYAELARNMGQTIDDIRKFYEENPKLVANFDQMVLEKKAIRLILDANEVEEVQGVFEDQASEAAETADVSDDATA